MKPKQTRKYLQQPQLSQFQALPLEQLAVVYGGSDPEWKYVPVRR